MSYYAAEIEQMASLLADALAYVDAVVAVFVVEKKSSSTSTRIWTHAVHQASVHISSSYPTFYDTDDIYQQLVGGVYFMRAYTMNNTTLKRLANDIRSWSFQVRKKKADPGVFRMDV